MKLRMIAGVLGVWKPQKTLALNNLAGSTKYGDAKPIGAEPTPTEPVLRYRHQETDKKPATQQFQSKRRHLRPDEAQTGRNS
jgi:hypothetical protein